MRWAACLSLGFAIPCLAVEPLPPAPPKLKELVLQEAHARELTRLTLDDLDLVARVDNDAYQALVGTYLFVTDPEGMFVFVNNFLDVAPDLSQEQRAYLRGQTLRFLNKDSTIVFAPPPGQPELYDISVFTDASCPFCARFHQEVAILNEEGVTVRYMAYPREGLRTEDNLETPGYLQTVAVWCHDDPHGALEKVMHGEQLKLGSCQNPVESYFWLGESFGLEGTPTIVFENGDMWTGYYTAIDVLEYLGNNYFPSRCEKQPSEQQAGEEEF